MSTSSISASVSQTYYNINISETISTGSASVNSNVPGSTGNHHGGGAFFHNVLQALQSLGLNISGFDSGSTSPAGSVSATGSTDTDGDNDQSGSSSTTPSTVQQALHTFLHDLHQALNQAGTLLNSVSPIQNSSSTGTDSDGDNDNSISPATGIQNGYSNVNSNLSSLISSLTNGSSANTTLQTDFANLVQALGGSSSNQNLTLQNFLQQLQQNITNNGSSINSTNNLLQAQA